MAPGRTHMHAGRPGTVRRVDLDIDPNAGPARRQRAGAVPAETPGWSPLGAGGRGLGAWHVRTGSRLKPAPATLLGAAGRRIEHTVHDVDVLVVGAGQAGLATAYHLQRAGFHGFAPTLGQDPAGCHHDKPTYVVLDDEDGPGGAWQHRWDSLTMATVNGIQDLPGAPMGTPDPDEPARISVTRYFTDYEDRFDLAILRPARVFSVERTDDDPHSPLRVTTSAGVWNARAVVAASGTWNRPFWPHVPGRHRFRGIQLHTHDYERADRFSGRRVVVVGGGISAVGHLLEISEVAKTLWCTRRPPDFRDTPFDAAAGRRVEEAVRARVEAGLPPQSVVSETGLLRTPEVEEGLRSGVLRARPMFVAVEPDGVRFKDGSLWSADAILWATGFRPDVPYLRPLHLRNRHGGIARRGTRVVAEPRVHLVGLGPDSSTVGARRSARQAVREISERLGVSG